MRYAWLLVFALATLAGACSNAQYDPATDDSVDGKEDRGSAGALPTFDEVDPTHSTASFRKYVGNALAILRDHPTPIGKLTYQAIRDRRVKIDELADITCLDYQRASKELGLKKNEWAKLHDPSSNAAKELAATLNGYMWSNRIYVSRGQRAQKLASTLVHEVNHVINHSEEGYFDDLPTSEFREEYRAFYAESTFDPKPFAGVDLVDHVIDLYELDRAGIAPALLKKPLTPRLLPDEEAWLDRDVDSDPVEPFDCPVD